MGIRTNIQNVVRAYIGLEVVLVGSPRSRTRCGFSLVKQKDVFLHLLTHIVFNITCVSEEVGAIVCIRGDKT